MDLSAHHQFPFRHICLVHLRNTSSSAVAYIAHFVNVGFRWWTEFFLYAFLGQSPVGPCICFMLKLLPSLLGQHDGVAWVRGFDHVACWLKPWMCTLCIGIYAGISGIAQICQITSLRHPSSSLEAAHPGRCGVFLPALNWLACCWLCKGSWTESGGNGRPDLSVSTAWIPLQSLFSLLSVARTKETGQAFSTMFKVKIPEFAIASTLSTFFCCVFIGEADIEHGHLLWFLPGQPAPSLTSV